MFAEYKSTLTNFFVPALYPFYFPKKVCTIQKIYLLYVRDSVYQKFKLIIPSDKACTATLQTKKLLKRIINSTT